jgi:multiple sugar transport system ATP-binding protein
MAQVRYDEATRIYPGTELPAVNKLDLDIADGEFLVVVGPSGSGKSTALRMLAGLEFIDAGSIHIGDRDVTLVPPKDRDIAMVFQNYALYPQMSVAANMGFALKQQGVPKDERQRRVAEAARILDLEPYLDRKPKNLSGGQRQRVAMGRAIVREPQVFLMDEPLSNLDAKLRVQTRTELADLQARLGVTMVYVTHDQVEAMTLGHRVAVLESGNLQQCASPRELYSKPINRFVAGFIGSPAMNLIEVENRDGYQLGSMALPFEAEVAQAASNHPSITLGVRPEHLRLAGAGAGAGGSGGAAGNGVAGEVTVVEDLGSESFAHVEIEHQGQTLQLVVRGAGETDTVRGDRVEVAIDGPLHAFDPAGARLG